MADRYTKYKCTYCQEDIAGLRVKCVECSDFDMCLECFSSGAEIGPHRKDHPYKFVDSGSLCVFGGRGNWTGQEQIQLLDAVDQYGHGNWEDISKKLGTRSPDEVEEEYNERYIDGNIGKLTWPATQNHKPNITDHSSPDQGPLTSELTSEIPPSDRPPEVPPLESNTTELSPVKFKSEIPLLKLISEIPPLDLESNFLPVESPSEAPPLEITPEEATEIGYNPSRNEFKWEYNSQAETLVSSLWNNQKEVDPLHDALKLSLVDMYANQLRERAKRKRFIRDYQLASAFFSSTTKDGGVTKKNRNREEKELRDRMRVFAQFMTSLEFEQLLSNLEREQQLKLRLSELFKYRENGITDHKECEHFEQFFAEVEDPSATDPCMENKLENA